MSRSRGAPESPPLAPRSAVNLCAMRSSSSASRAPTPRHTRFGCSWPWEMPRRQSCPRLAGSPAYMKDAAIDGAKMDGGGDSQREPLPLTRSRAVRASSGRYSYCLSAGVHQSQPSAGVCWQGCGPHSTRTMAIFARVASLAPMRVRSGAGRARRPRSAAPGPRRACSSTATPACPTCWIAHAGAFCVPALVPSQVHDARLFCASGGRLERRAGARRRLHCGSPGRRHARQAAVRCVSRDVSMSARLLHSIGH